jgi:hypothetical protein
MKKNGKEAEDTRYHGTALGQDSELQPVQILGGAVTSISEWVDQFRVASSSAGERKMGAGSEMDEGEFEAGDDEKGSGRVTTPATDSVLSSAPLTPMAEAG